MNRKCFFIKNNTRILLVQYDLVVLGIPGCGGLLTESSGQFTSPQHPETYANHLDCEWVIRVPNGDRVEIDFLSFDLEEHSNCR